MNSSTSAIPCPAMVICSWFFALILITFVFCILTFNPTRLASSIILAVLSWICSLHGRGCYSTTSSANSRSSSLEVNFHLKPFSPRPWPTVLLITKSITTTTTIFIEPLIQKGNSCEKKREQPLRNSKI